MTPADPLTVLLDRACRGLTSDEAAALRAAVHQLRQRAAYAERRAEQWEQARDAEVLTTARVFDEYYRRWQSTIVQARRQARHAARYRAAWQSARRRTRYIPDAGQEIHDGTRWRPALQAYSVLRARLARAEQQLATLHEGEQPYEDERIVPTPGQWIWQWSRATPERRQEIAALVLEQQDRLNHYTWTERPELHERAEAAERRLAALHGQTPQPAEPPTHQADIRVDDDGERNVSCPDCPAYVDNIGDEDDANEWAERHRAEATSSQAPR